MRVSWDLPEGRSGVRDVEARDTVTALDWLGRLMASLAVHRKIKGCSDRFFSLAIHESKYKLDVQTE